MQSVLLQISVQLRFLALRLHIVRCRLLANSEDNRATQQQLLSLLQALEGAEMQLRKEYNRVYVTPGATGDMAPILRSASPRIHDVACDSKDNQSHTVIDLNAARNARARHNPSFLSCDFRPDPLTR